MEPVSANFGFLAEIDERLPLWGAQAERYFADDPNTCIVKMGQFCELLARLSAESCGIELQPNAAQTEVLGLLRGRAGLSREVLDLFHNVRKARNVAVHDGLDHRSTALSCLKFGRKLGVWYMRAFGDNREFSAGPFSPPTVRGDETEKLRAEINRLRQERDAALTDAEAARAKKEEEEQLRLTAEQLAEERAQELAELEALAVEAENVAAARIAALEAGRAPSGVLGHEVPAEAVAETKINRAAVDAANTAALQISLDEADTRRIIDAQLRAAGWDADSESMRHGLGARPQKGRNVAIAEWPTASGPADYVLFIGLIPVATVEAKRQSKSVSGDIDQAQRYSRDFTFDGDLEPAGDPWGEYKIPFTFASNGRPYLKQLETESGVWFCDVRRPHNLRRPLDGWYTPEGLKDLLKLDVDAAQEQLRAEPFDYGFKLRDFQERAIRALEGALETGQQNCLLAMATGTGKTKTAVAMLYRFLKAQRFRRILFLVDRSALGEQAAGAFKTTRMEQLKNFADIYTIAELEDTSPEAETKVHIATIQGMVRRVLFAEDDDTMPPVDQYDCIIVDECHRGYLLDRELGDAELSFSDQADYISKYRRVIDHFDAVKVGLTATPALHTTEIFGEPVFSYGYREAVIDGWLVDHEPPFNIRTALAEEGIDWARGEELELLKTRTGEIDLVHAPDELHFDVADFNRKVVTEPFNRVVCEQLALHIDPTLNGKTLVFCANDRHADLVVKLLKDAFAEEGVPVTDDMVAKITGAADKPSSLIRRYKNEKMPNVAVTVDLLTTGIDVPEICNLVFLRRVNSRILYEQMLGRATRLCPEIGKDAFRIFDAVGIYELLEDVTEMKPVVANPNITFEKLVSDLLAAPSDEAREFLQEQLVVKLRRSIQRMSDTARENLAAELGQAPEEFLKQLEASGSEGELRALLNALPDRGRVLDRRWDDISPVVAISHHHDELRTVTRGYGAGGRPEDYLDEFSAFIREHMNDIPALKVVSTRPQDLSREELKALRLQLAQAGYPERSLQTAWHDKTNAQIAASIIGFIRQAALGEPLVPYPERVDRAVAKLQAKHAFNANQEQWLTRIANQMKQETIVDREAFDRGQFAASGGFRRLNKVFGGKLEALVQELGETVWKEAG